MPDPNPNPSPNPSPNPLPNPSPQAAWHASISADAETLGYLQNRGLDKLDGNAAAVSLLKSYREAESRLGAPADRVLKLPEKPDDAEGWNAVYQRLGKPKDAKEYDFSALKFKDGSDLDPAFAEFMRTAAHKYNLPKDAAQRLTQEFMQFVEGNEGAGATETAAALAVEQDTLKKNWGANFEVNKLIASNAAKTLGLKPEVLAVLDKTAGHAAVMEMFRDLGVRLGEDKFVGGKNASGNGVMTREGAASRKAELLKDPAWISRYNAGGVASPEFKEMADLNRLITGDYR